MPGRFDVMILAAGFLRHISRAVKISSKFSKQCYLAGLPFSRHSATRSEICDSPMHMTVSAPPQ